MAFDSRQSNFKSGEPAAAWFRRTTSTPDQIYAWQGRRIYRAFKELLAYRTQGITGPTGRDITMSEGPTTIAVGDLSRFQTLVEQQAASGDLTQATADSMVTALAEAIRGGSMTPGAMSAILWMALSAMDNPPRYEEIVVPENTIFPALGVAPDSDPNGLPEMRYWNSNTNPPPEVPVLSITPNNNPAQPPARTGGMSGWTVALLIGIPVLLAVIVGVWVWMEKRKTSGAGSASMRELRERYGTIYMRESAK